MNNESKLKKNMFLLIVLVISGASIYLLPYLRSFYYDAFRDAFNMTNEETGRAGAAFGLFGAFSYIIGGLISDKVSIKILIPGSMIVSGGLGLFLLTSPSPTIIMIIHGIWGITSLMTFWPALVKALRMVGNANEQGKVFGIFEGGRGVTNAVVYAIAAGLFGMFFVAGSEFKGIAPVILLYSSVSIILGVANIFLLRGIDTSADTEEGGSMDVKMIGQILKNPNVWMICIIIFCSYTVTMSNYYIAPYATAGFNLSILAASVLSSSSQYIRPFASIGAGIMGDRINSSKVMLIGMMVSIVGLVAILATPAGASVVPILIGCVFVFTSMFMTQAMHFAIMEETTIRKETTGTVIGLCCTIGYLPEAITPLVAGKILDSYPSNSLQGYRMIFMILIGITIVGILVTLLWIRRTKERRMELLKMRKIKENPSK